MQGGWDGKKLWASLRLSLRKEWWRNKSTTTRFLSRSINWWFPTIKYLFCSRSLQLCCSNEVRLWCDYFRIQTSGCIIRLRTKLGPPGLFQWSRILLQTPIPFALPTCVSQIQLQAPTKTVFAYSKATHGSFWPHLVGLVIILIPN